MALVSTGIARRLSGPPVLALLLALLTFGAGVRYGSFVAGGADSYGYLSQAELWVHCQLRIHEPLFRHAPWPSADWTLSPLGYRPAFERNGDIVPVYAPGLPLTLAAFQSFGGRQAGLLVVPLLGALAVWLTYRLGTCLNGGHTGVVAAVWLASSPAFLYSLMTPMSDVPTMTWWLLAIVLLTNPTRASALAAGLAAGVAVLTRPNLVPLAGVIASWILWDAVRSRSLIGPAAQRVALFVAGLIPGCVAIALLFNYWYGSPFQSGYGSLQSLYAWSHARSNAPNYTRWLVETLTPLAALALVAPWVLRKIDLTGRLDRARALALAWLTLGFLAALLIIYVFYLPFDAWWYVRFLLPAYPLLVVTSAALLVAGLARLKPAVRTGALAVLCVLLAAAGVTVAARRSAFALGPGELKYPRVARYIAVRIPAQAIIVSMQHSGSVRYYADRLTVRYDKMPPEFLDRALEYLQAQERTPYILLEDWEETAFRDRFAARSAFGRLDWPPMAEFHTISGGLIHLYAPRDRERYLRGEPVVTEQAR